MRGSGNNSSSHEKSSRGSARGPRGPARRTCDTGSHAPDVALCLKTWAEACPITDSDMAERGRGLSVLSAKASRLLSGFPRMRPPPPSPSRAGWRLGKASARRWWSSRALPISGTFAFVSVSELGRGSEKQSTPGCGGFKKALILEVASLVPSATTSTL